MVDINAQILHGFRLPLSVAFESNLLDPQIICSDDYQIISFDESRDEVIDRNVISPILRKVLEGGQWNIYILTSSQDESNPDSSYFFLYDKRQELHCGHPPDYKTGQIRLDFQEPTETVQILSNVFLPDTYSWKYNLHWIIESDW